MGRLENHFKGRMAGLDDWVDAEMMRQSQVSEKTSCSLEHPVRVYSGFCLIIYVEGLPPTSQNNGNKPSPWSQNDLCRGIECVSGTGLALMWTQLDKEEKENYRKWLYSQDYSAISWAVSALPSTGSEAYMSSLVGQSRFVSKQVPPEYLRSTRLSSRSWRHQSEQTSKGPVSAAHILEKTGNKYNHFS